jgi:hypothetical protein
MRVCIDHRSVDGQPLDPELGLLPGRSVPRVSILDFSPHHRMAVVFTHMPHLSYDDSLMRSGALSYHTRSAGFVARWWLAIQQVYDCIDTSVNNLIALISGKELAPYLARFLAPQVGHRI